MLAALASGSLITGSLVSSASAHEDNLVIAPPTEISATSNIDSKSIGEAASISFASLMQMIISPAQATGNVSITTKGRYRYIRSTGIADHATGQFPNSRNPNRIRAQKWRFRVPLNPKKTGKATSMLRRPFGVAINGVTFDPGTAEAWNNNPRSGWNGEAIGGRKNLGLDSSNAHVQPNGAYHYHGIPDGLLKQFAVKKAPVLLGYAADGFPIYGPYGYANSSKAGGKLVKLDSSYQLKSGSRPAGSSGPGGRYDGSYTQDYAYVAGGGDLDQCNGRTSVTKEYPQGTYHYVLTDDFPFVPRCVMGTPDSSFKIRKGRRPGMARRGQNNRRKSLRPRLRGQGQDGRRPRRHRRPPQRG